MGTPIQSAFLRQDMGKQLKMGRSICMGLASLHLELVGWQKQLQLAPVGGQSSSVSQDGANDNRRGRQMQSNSMHCDWIYSHFNGMGNCWSFGWPIQLARCV